MNAHHFFEKVDVQYTRLANSNSWSMSKKYKMIKNLLKYLDREKHSFTLLENVLNLDFYQLARPKLCDGSQIHEITLGRE